MKRDVALLALAVMFAGCSLAPALDTPPSGLPDAFPTGPMASTDSVAAHALDWQEFFLDPQLRQLIGTALENNQDLAAATARIEQAEAQFRIQNSLRIPTLNAGMGSQRTGSPSPTGVGRTTGESHSVQVFVPAFELDFWGRLANLSESSRRQYLATVEARQAFRLSVVGSVATAYFVLRSSEDGIALAQRTLDSRRETRDLAQLRMDAGLTSSVPYDQSHALVNQAETQLTQLVEARDRALTWLRALTGVDVEAMVQPGGNPLGGQEQLAKFATGLPSDLLSHRPDIRRAEHRLIAANANIGVARAAYFPSIALTGSNGYASADLSGLFSSGSNFWSIGANALLPIFDMGRRRAQVRAAEAGLDEREAEYRQSILNAFREVHDGLNALQSNADRIASLQRTVAVQQSLAGTAQSRYDVGLSPYLEVLDAERGLFAAQQALLQAQSADLQSRVNLYLALGGGEDPQGFR
jgi:multidrug efflux system outer membrane protein